METNRLRLVNVVLGLVVLATIAGTAHSASKPPPQCDPEFTHCTRVVFDSVVENSCNGEFVALQGYFHFMTKTTVDPVTGSITVYSRTNWQDVKGVSVLDLSGTPDPTPTNYSAADTTKTEMQTFPPAEKVRTENHANNELVSHGTEPNQIIHMKTLIIVDPPAEPVIETQGPGVKCRG